MRLVFVPLGWLATALAARLGISPNVATLIRIVVTLLALFAVGAVSQWLFIAGVTLYFITLVLDHVDGNLSRVLDRATYFGKFFDGVCDSLAEIFLPVALSVHVWRIGGNAEVLAAGGIAGCALAFTQIIIFRSVMISQTYALAKTVGNEGSAMAHPVATRWLERGIIKRVAFFFDVQAQVMLWDLRYAGLILAMILGALNFYVYFLAVAQSIVLLGLATVRITTCYAEFDIHRRSKSAAS